MTAWYRRYENLSSGRTNGENIIITLHVQPGARVSEIAGIHGEALKIRLAAPPVEGRANEVLQKFIAELFSVSRRQVELIQGAQSRRKVVVVRGSLVDPETLLDQR